MAALKNANQESRVPLSKYLALANGLLTTLPAAFRDFFLEHCELVALQRQDVLTSTGQDTEHAYFPIDSFVGELISLEGTSAVQVALIGNEGMVNLPLVLGIQFASTTSVVQGNGRAYRIRNFELQELLCGNPFLRDVLHRYIALRMDQLALNLACASCHPVEKRLARWMLMARDRARSNELCLTHETLALMLGVRRESVTQAAISLQNHGLIRYGRGDIELLDQSGLKAVACSCYAADLAMYERAVGLQDSRQQAPPEN